MTNEEFSKLALSLKAITTRNEDSVSDTTVGHLAIHIRDLLDEATRRARSERDKELRELVEKEKAEITDLYAKIMAEIPVPKNQINALQIERDAQLLALDFTLSLLTPNQE